MKACFTFFMFLLIQLQGFSQNVGINNTDPQTALDIAGRLRLRPELIVVTSSSVTIPSGNTGYYRLSGTPATDFTVTLPAGVAGSFLVLENTTSRTAVLTGLARVAPGNSRLLLQGNAGWILANDTESQLEKVTESGSTGWRLLGSSSRSVGRIGDKAVDLSGSTVVSLSTGATGFNSFATGFSTSAQGLYSTAINFETDASGSYSLAAGYNSIATGLVGTALGESTRSLNHRATTMGYFTTASGIASTAMGDRTIASGQNSTAIGFRTMARAYASVALGAYNDTIAGSDMTTWVATDPVLTVGNGTAGALSNAVTVYKNGNTDMNGFVRLGNAAENAPRVKMKRITTTLDANANASIAHGLTESKILSIRVRVTNAFNSVVFDGCTIANNSFNAYLNAGSVVVLRGSTFGDLINRPAVIIITYEE